MPAVAIRMSCMRPLNRAGAEVVVRGEDWHHGEAAQQGALPAALPAQHNQLGRLPALQGGHQNVS
eukprot:scaffold14033_cov32-Prasinocladus_malaysianus.AAC.1